MAILEWVALAALGGFIHKGIKESQERAVEEQRRKSTPCYFNDGISRAQCQLLVD